MVRSFIKGSALALVAGAVLAGSATTAQAGSLVAGGWQANWDSSFEDSSGTFVTLTLLAETNDAIVLQKVAAFTSGPDQYGLIAPIEINFSQLTRDAAKKIVITSENVWNSTGSDWDNFKFIIEDGTTGDPAKDVHFNIQESFLDGNPFDASPFSTYTASGITALPQTLTFAGGVVADGTVWTPGIGTNPDAGEVVINANPSMTGTTRFVFKELPHAVPLPAAAWMGLSSLAFIAIPRAVRKARALIA